MIRKQGKRGASEEEVDEAVEHLLRRQMSKEIDFEADDAIEKVHLWSQIAI